MNNFFSREVHKDSKGFFVYFGGFRFRPRKGLKTKAVLGERVMLDPEPYYSTKKITRHTFIRNHIGYVFVSGQKESWTKGLKHREEIPQWFIDKRR